MKPLSQIHGTRRGYQRHKALGGIPCRACNEANNAYNAGWQREHYSAEKRHRRYVEKGY